MGPTVVLVDDHDSFRRAACRLLIAAGCRVIGEAATARSGIETAQRLGPDAVVVDVMLPDGSGFEVARQLAEPAHRPRIVLISSRPAEDYGDRLVSSPADAFVPKSELTAELLAEVLG